MSWLKYLQIGSHWIARILGVLLLLLVLTIFIGESQMGEGPDFSILTSVEIWLFVVMFAMLAGIVVSFWKETIGGSITSIAALIFMLTVAIDNRGSGANLVMASFLVTGLLFFLSSYLKKRLSAPTPPPAKTKTVYYRK